MPVVIAVLKHYLVSTVLNLCLYQCFHQRTSLVCTCVVASRLKKEKLDSVNSYIKMRKFPRKLSRQLRKHFRELYDTKVSVNEEAILLEMSSDLRVEVSKYLVSELMEVVMPFRDMSSLQWAKVLPLLTPHVFNHGDVLCWQGDYCAESIIVVDGELEGFTSSKQLTRTLSGGPNQHPTFAADNNQNGNSSSKKSSNSNGNAGRPLLSPTSTASLAKSLGLPPVNKHEHHHHGRRSKSKRKRHLAVVPSVPSNAATFRSTTSDAAVPSSSPSSLPAPSNGTQRFPSDLLPIPGNIHDEVC